MNARVAPMIPFLLLPALALAAGAPPRPADNNANAAAVAATTPSFDAQAMQSALLDLSIPKAQLQKIRAARPELARRMPTPTPAATPPATTTPPGPPLDPTRLVCKPQPQPQPLAGATDATRTAPRQCDEVCCLAKLICSAHAKICAIAARRPEQLSYQDTCDSAAQDCDDAKVTCRECK